MCGLKVEVEFINDLVIYNVLVVDVFAVTDGTETAEIVVSVFVAFSKTQFHPAIIGQKDFSLTAENDQ